MFFLKLCKFFCTDFFLNWHSKYQTWKICVTKTMCIVSCMLNFSIKQWIWDILFLKVSKWEAFVKFYQLSRKIKIEMQLFDLFSKPQSWTRAQIEGENSLWFEYLLLSLFVHDDNVILLEDTHYSWHDLWPGIWRRSIHLLTAARLTRSSLSAMLSK